MAAYGLDPVHGEPEPAGQLDAEVSLACADVQRGRARRQAKVSDQIKKQVQAARGQGLVKGGFEGLLLGEGRAVDLFHGAHTRRPRCISHNSAS